VVTRVEAFLDILWSRRKRGVGRVNRPRRT
jgi:hypothetical protein